jgi:hypothetical protein
MPKRHSRILLSVFNIIAFIGVVVVNYLANALPLGGKTTGQISDQYPNLFVPSGITFSIWGVIYVLLAIYVIYGLITSIKTPAQNDSFVRKIGVLFIITCIANIAWIFSWHYEVLPLSLIFMVVLLVTLAVMYERLDVGRKAARPTEKYLVHLPVSTYFGWITVATIANVTALLVAYKWNRFGLGEEFWAVIMIGIGTILALLLLFSRRDLFYALVVNWAVIGILIKRIADTSTPAKNVTITSIACISVMTIVIAFQIIRGNVYR